MIFKNMYVFFIRLVETNLFLMSIRMLRLHTNSSQAIASTCETQTFVSAR